MARRKQQEDPQPGAPLWMTTYGDMVTLLLCFFVLLFSFSIVDKQKFESMIGSFQGSLGILDGDNSMKEEDFITEALKNNLTIDQRQELEDFRKLEEVLEEYLEGSNLDSEVLVSQENAGLVLRFRDS